MTVQKLNMHESMSSEFVRLVITPSDIARKGFLYAQETGFLEKSLQTVELDHLDSFLLLFVHTGKGKLIYEKKEYQLQAGNIFFIDCKNHFKYYPTTKEGWKALYLYFNGNEARFYYNIISKGEFQILNVINEYQITSRFWQIIDLHRKKSKFAELLTSLHIIRLLTELCMFSNDSAILDVEFPEYINKVFNHIDHYYDEKISLDMLSELYSVNKYHMAREFKRCSGTTINEYVIIVRINKAKELLHYTEMSVGEIADELGYYSSGHLIKQFRKREHITPLAYRKQWTE